MSILSSSGVRARVLACGPRCKKPGVAAGRSSSRSIIAWRHAGCRLPGRLLAALGDDLVADLLALASERIPAFSTAEMWTNTSFERHPVDEAEAFLGIEDFTVPTAIAVPFTR